MTPSKIKLNKEEGSLSLEYSDGSHFTLTGEYLRVHSPSAEVRGHGKGQEVLQFGKKDVKVANLEASGNYAIQITFDDGHDSEEQLYAVHRAFDDRINAIVIFQTRLLAIHFGVGQARHHQSGQQNRSRQ